MEAMVDQLLDSRPSTPDAVIVPTESKLKVLKSIEWDEYKKRTNGVFKFDRRGPCLYTLVEMENANDEFALFHRVLGCSHCCKAVPIGTGEGCVVCANALYCSSECKMRNLTAHCLDCAYYEQVKIMVVHLIETNPEKLLKVWFK